jgi:hypothetical protein
MIRVALRASWSQFASTAALPLIVALAYLALVVAPCPPILLPPLDAPHAHHAVNSYLATAEDSPSLVGPCPCGCEPHKSGLGSGKREPALAFAMPTLPAFAPFFDDETAARLPDAPVSVDSPIPIVA